MENENIEKWYNVTFRLGPDDGNNEIYRLKCNYPVNKLEQAIKDAREKLGFDFVYDVCDESLYVKGKILDILIKYDLIEDYQIIEEKEGLVGLFDSPDDFVEYLFKCLKLVLPDIVFYYRNLKDVWLDGFENSAIGILDSYY